MLEGSSLAGSNLIKWDKPLVMVVVLSRTPWRCLGEEKAWLGGLSIARFLRLEVDGLYTEMALDSRTINDSEMRKTALELYL